MNGRRGSLVAGALVLVALPAGAVNFEAGDFLFSWNNRISAGAMWRIEERDPELVAKLNLDPDLCQDATGQTDDCISFNGDPAPNQRLVDAPGAFFGHVQDDGNLNYEQGDLVSALARVTSDFGVTWRDYTFKARGIAFFDAINDDFQDRHPNTDFQPARTDRTEHTRRLVGTSVELLDLFVTGTWYWGERTVSVSLGQQKVRWGEANLIALNSLSEINPPDARRLRQPGTQINEIFQPVPLVQLSLDLTANVLGEVFYQFGWRPVIPDPGGSFFADVDVLERNRPYAIIALGQFPEDPEGEKRLPGAGAFISGTSLTARFLPWEAGEPPDTGQFGLRLNVFAEDLNNGTELGFYFMNYHSRLPYLSLYATDESCMREALTFADAFAMCNGFNGDINMSGQGGEPLPIDTLRVLADYPQDIQMFGVSFNTNIGAWSWAGEYSLRPQLPVQVSVPDVVFAALQPAFPRQDVRLEIPGVVSGAVVPGSRAAVPDYIQTLYRGRPVQPNQLIRGYERLNVGQLALTGIRILGSSDNWFAAEQQIMLLELGFTHIIGMPSLDRIQFDAGSPNRTHYSPGADGSGDPGGEPDTRRFNPTRQTTAFVDEFSWGYRLLTQLEYNDLFLGLNFKPFAIFVHDISGYAPTPMQNFIEGRMEWQLGTDIAYGQRWNGQIVYQGYHGNRHFSRRDRDNIGFSVAYTF